MRGIALALVVAGCSVESEEPVKGPDVAAIPAGKGWECFRERMRNESLCYRPGACEPARAGIAEEFRRTGAAFDITTCIARTSAACFTGRLATNNEVIALCTELMSECEKGRASLASSTDYSEISGRCGSYN